MHSQREVCERYGSPLLASGEDETLGAALETLHLLPLNALRHSPENGTCGWYIWGGETLSPEPTFFQPLHVHHVVVHAPQLVPFLALAPGWRVLIAPEVEDVWYDASLLNS